MLLSRFCTLVLLGGGLLGLAGLSGLGCGSNDSAILATLGPAPSRTSQLTVTATLDNKPAMMPLQLMPTDTEFGVDLPPTASGQLVLSAQALDSDGCMQAGSTGMVTLPSGRTDLPMPLMPSSPRKCGMLAGCAATTVCDAPKVQGQTIQSIWPISASDIWAVGLNALLMHYDGVSWKVVGAPAGFTNHLFGVWAAATNNVWAIGDLGTILH